MITVRNKDDDTVCGIDDLVLNWGEHINHLYYDHDVQELTRAISSGKVLA